MLNGEVLSDATELADQVFVVVVVGVLVQEMGQGFSEDWLWPNCVGVRPTRYS